MRSYYKNKIVVYRHLRPDGKVFYVGIGSYDRAYNKDNRTDFWKRIVDKYGYEVQILTSFDDREDACELEKVLISYYGRRDLGTGYLVNLTDGGEGREGMSEECKRKIGDATRGRKISEWHKQRLFEGRDRRVLSDEVREAMAERCRNKIISESTREKFKDNYKSRAEELINKARKANSKPVVQLTLDGIFVKEWESMSEVKRQTGIDPFKNVKHLSKHAGNYLWRYKDEYEKN